MPSSTEHLPDRETARSQMAHRRGFWLVAASFITLMAFTTVPTPMYPLYQQRDGFATFVITLIFAAYGFGVMAGLYFAGHLSDHLGRRKVIVAATALQLVSAVIFIAWQDVTPLLIARFICGFGIGAMTSTATAALGELRATGAPQENPRFASTVATAVNMGGLSLGPLLGGILVQWVPGPLTTPFVLFFVLLTGAGVLMLFVPETVPEQLRESRPAYRPQRVQVERRFRAEFAASAIAAAAAFAVMGFYTALTGSFLGATLGVHSPLVVGTTVFALMGSCAASQVGFVRMSARPKLQWGRWLMVTGLLLAAGAGLARSLPMFIVAGVFAGAGVGLVFTSAIGAAARMAPPQRRAETVAGMFLAAYTGITVPVIACGVALTWIDPVVVLVTFAVIVLVVVFICAGRMLRSIGRS